jgi:hypothetical protein
MIGLTGSLCVKRWNVTSSALSYCRLCTYSKSLTGFGHRKLTNKHSRSNDTYVAKPLTASSLASCHWLHRRVSPQTHLSFDLRNLLLEMRVQHQTLAWGRWGYPQNGPGNPPQMREEEFIGGGVTRRRILLMVAPTQRVE